MRRRTYSGAGSLIVKISELTTLQAEQWLATMRKLRHENTELFGDGGDMSVVEHQIVSAKAASAAGIIDIDIETMRLGEVVAAGKAVWDAYDEAMRIDPN